MNFDFLKNNVQLILVVFMIFSVFVGLSCISAAENGSNVCATSDCSHVGLTDGVSEVNDNTTVPSHDEASKINDPNDASTVSGNNDTFTMSVKYNSGTGYHWVVSDESYGVDLISTNNVVDHPGLCGSSGTTYFYFHVNSDDYYVKLLCISPTGKVVDEVDSDMLN